jgi:hypothetical protein
MENKCGITGEIRQAIKKVQQDTQVKKIDKSGYAAMKDMNNKLSCKLGTCFLRSPAIKNKFWRFYCLVRQGRLPTEVYKAKVIQSHIPEKC